MSSITALSYWFPKLVSARLPVPKTVIIPTEKHEREALYRLALREDNEILSQEIVDVYTTVLNRIREVADDFGYPCFLRTDYTAMKHDWIDTCYLSKSEDIEEHVTTIIYQAECVGMEYLDEWVIRELLPTKKHGVFRKYGGLPIVKEFRFFVDGGSVTCWHPYWPEESMEQGNVLFNQENYGYAELCALESDVQSHLEGLAIRAGNAVDGQWSVDFIETEIGWYIIDMAEACKSFHWPSCLNAES